MVAKNGQRSWQHPDKQIRRRGFDELGYHFVIDNGRGGADGLIETSRRWRLQKWGAHTGGTPGNEYNNYGIGICLVGNFTKTRPTRRQLASLRHLLRFVCTTCGIPPERITAHAAVKRTTWADSGSSDVVSASGGPWKRLWTRSRKRRAIVGCAAEVHKRVGSAVAALAAPLH